MKSKNIIYLSIAAALSLQAAEPMTSTSMSTDRGGTKSAIDAYSDGGGAYLFDEKNKAVLDNSAMNSLVFKYGEAAKENFTTIADQVKSISADATATEKALADKIITSNVTVNPPSNGTQCNDFNNASINDIYTDGVCAGTIMTGQCDDHNNDTIDDVYINGFCVGTAQVGIANGMYSDGNKADSCWSYYNGSKISSTEYLPQTQSGTYYLKDGRIANCNMQALIKIHNNNDWSGIISSTGANCYLSKLITSGTNNGDVYPHPMNSSYCSAFLNTNNIFKSISFYIFQEPGSASDGTGWKYYSNKQSVTTGTLTVGAQTETKIVNPGEGLYFQTNSPSGANSGDWIHYKIVGFEE